MQKEITLVGSRPFPIDMLRYDGCYPRLPSDVTAIEDSLKEGAFSADLKPTFEVTLVVNRPFTEGRWNTFGWYVKK